MTKKSKDEHSDSRYQRVRHILDMAAGGSEAQYQGYRDFWNLPLDELLELKLFGYRMIAPPESKDTGFAPIPADSPDDNGQDTDSGSATSSCCASSEDATPSRGGRPGRGGGQLEQPGAGQRPPGRGARSWLVKALKGEFPFDGSHYPPFLWGQKAVPVVASDIQFIVDWIDDGCPAQDADPEVVPSGNGQGVASSGYGKIVSMTNGFRDEAGEINLRLNALYLTPEEQKAIRTAVRELKKLNVYTQDNRSFNAWARIHGDHCQHGWEQFLTWHRIFLYQFERRLQQVVPGVTLPYWEWTNPYFQNGIVPEGRQSGIIPPLYRCWIDESVLANLKGKVSSDVQGALAKIETDGANSDLMYNSAWELFVQAGLDMKDYLGYGAEVVDQLVLVNPMWHPLRYPGMFYKGASGASSATSWQQAYELDSSTGEPILSAAAMGGQFHHHYPLAQDIEQILDITTWPSFGGGHTANQSFGALSQNPHNTGHIWLGGGNPFFDNSDIRTLPTFGPDPMMAQPQYGDMFQDVLAGYDPMFWGHHSNVDRLFYEWQQRHPGVGPDDINDVILPFDARVEQAMNAEKLGYRYAASSRLMMADSQLETNKLCTDAMAFHPQLLKCHSRAEITFHQVCRSNKSYFVRVFLNLPEANASTPIENNEHYVGRFARFGHGGCIGGPGHCDPPPRQRPGFWREQRHHNDDHCYSLDATAAVQRLIANGDSEFHITVVTVDASGEATEGLCMQGLSLNFYD